MKVYFAMVVAAVVMISGLAHADRFDDKARAAAESQEQADQAKAYAASLKALNANNAAMVRRVPRNATLTQCFDIEAFRYRDEENGCRLGDTQWNGVPVQICLDGMYSDERTLPPEIVMCHYSLPNGKDCEMYRNASIKPRCL